jgi:hypothetical protein
MSEPRRIAISLTRRHKLQHYELLAGDIRIGSAAHCDVRLAPDEAAPEQLSIQAAPEGVRLRNLAAQHPVQLDGAPLTDAVVTGAATLELSGVTLSLQLLAAQKPGNKAGPSLAKRVRQLGLIACVGLGYYFVLHEEPVASAFERATTPPELFPELRQIGCRQREKQSADAFAEQQLRAAEGKRERSPYSVQDGMQAVPLYAEAAACFRIAGRREDAHDSGEAAARLASQLQDDLHAHQVRLEWALDRKRWDAAARELLVMRELVAGRNDAHAQWLAAVSRELRGLADQSNHEE